MPTAVRVSTYVVTSISCWNFQDQRARWKIWDKYIGISPSSTTFCLYEVAHTLRKFHTPPNSTAPLSKYKFELMFPPT